jgi:hypothetical protein
MNVSKPKITDEDFVENILVPELESQLYAYLTETNQPIPYNDRMIAIVSKAVEVALSSMDPADLEKWRRYADESVRRMLFG